MGFTLPNVLYLACLGFDRWEELEWTDSLSLPFTDSLSLPFSDSLSLAFATSPTVGGSLPIFMVFSFLGLRGLGADCLLWRVRLSESWERSSSKMEGGFMSISKYI